MLPLLCKKTQELIEFMRLIILIVDCVDTVKDRVPVFAGVVVF